MQSLMSINYKFMEFSPNELITIIKNNSEFVKGFEIAIDIKKENEINYLKSLAHACKQHNMIFEVHGNSSLSIEEQIPFLKLLENISNDLGYKINVVLHPIYHEDINESIELTTNYTTTLSKLINNDKIRLSLENLNDINNQDRLNKDDITPIICNNEHLFFTYDIGHEISDYGSITNIEPSLIPLISNVHIHSISFNYDGGYDHKPIFKDDEHWNAILKAILFLKNNNYEKNIVFEYNVYECFGNTLEEQIISYAKSIDYVSNRF